MYVQGTQHTPDEIITHEVGMSAASANLSVPSGQPAFLFYAPSKEANNYTTVFSDVIKEIESKTSEDVTSDGKTFRCNDKPAP